MSLLLVRAGDQAHRIAERIGGGVERIPVAINAGAQLIAAHSGEVGRRF